MAQKPVKKSFGKTLIGLMFSFLMLSGTLLAALDLSFAIYQYLSFVNTLEKGVRFAAKVIPAENFNFTEVSFVSKKEETLKQYIEVLLGSQGFNIKAVNINTKTLRPGQIFISIEKKYYSLFGFFNNIPMAVQGTAYLQKKRQEVNNFYPALVTGDAV